MCHTRRFEYFSFKFYYYNCMISFFKFRPSFLDLLSSNRLSSFYETTKTNGYKYTYNTWFISTKSDIEVGFRMLEDVRNSHNRRNLNGDSSCLYVIPQFVTVSSHRPTVLDTVTDRWRGVVFLVLLRDPTNSSRSVLFLNVFTEIFPVYLSKRIICYDTR